MDKKLFAELKESVTWMGRHMRGKARVGRVFEYPETDVKLIRKKAKISQSKFAQLIGVNVKTLQNWEQKRVRPAGPARALLRIVAANPKAAIRALHQ